MSSPSFDNNRIANGYYQEANCFISQDDYITAVYFLNKALQYDPTEGQYFKDRSFCLHQLATYESINHQYQQYLEKNDLDNYYLLPIFQTYFNQCNLDDYSFQVAYTNNSIPCKFVDCIKDNLLRDAIRDSSIAINLEENDVSAYEQLADSYKELGDDEQYFYYLLKASKYDLLNQLNDVFNHLQSRFTVIFNEQNYCKENLEKQISKLERQAQILKEQIYDDKKEIERLERNTKALKQKLSETLL